LELICFWSEILEVVGCCGIWIESISQLEIWILSPSVREKGTWILFSQVSEILNHQYYGQLVTLIETWRVSEIEEAVNLNPEENLSEETRTLMGFSLRYQTCCWLKWASSRLVSKFKPAIGILIGRWARPLPRFE